MKKLFILTLVLLFSVIGYGQNKESNISKNETFKDLTFNASDTINESETYYIEVTNKQSFPQMQDVYVAGSAVSGSGDVVITLYGKKFTDDSYSSLGTSTWNSTLALDEVITISTANRYRFLKLEFVSDATAKQVLLTDVKFKTWMTGGDLSTATLALSSNLTVGGTTVLTGLLTANGGVTLGAGDDLIGSSTSDITFNTDKFTVAGATGNTVVAGSIALNGTVGLGDAVTDVTTLNGTITSDQTYAAGTTPFYFRTSLTATSGDHNNGRFRAQSTAVGSSTSDIRGLYSQGVTNEALFGGAVTAIYANSIAKGTSTTTTLRGILIDTESEGTPTAIGNMYGLYIRNKSTVAITSDNYSMVIDNEKMGTGIVQDAGIQLKTTTWGSGITAWTYGIDMNQTGAFGTADIRFQNGETLSNATDGVLDVGAAAVQSATYNFADATAVAGTADAITIDFTADLTVSTGTMITFIAESAVTGAATLNVDGAGALAISKYNGSIGALSANDIRSGQVVTVVYDGSVFVMMSPIGN